MMHCHGLERPILKGEVNFPVCLAPMVGLSHLALRLLVRDYLPQGARTIWPTEMLNSRRLPHENLEKTPETLRAPFETHLVPQILGNEEKAIAQSVEKLTEWGASGIDINMGCPVQKALKHNYGVALMGDPAYAAEVVRMTVRHSTLPVSVKLRAAPPTQCEASGKERSFLRDFVRGLEDAGAAWVTLHPRTAAQKRRGSADWSQIGEIREQTSCAVIGNGDIQTADDVLRMLRETNCDAVMVGRALTARPWLVWQVGEKLGWPAPPNLAHRLAPQTPLEEGTEYGRALKRVAAISKEIFTQELGLRKFRFFVRTSMPWLQYGQALYGASTKAKSWSELEDALEVFFARDHEMSARTSAAH